jgi:DNA repair protein RadA/Sms
MPKSSTMYVCQQCGYQAPQFLGKCPECGAWGSLVETVTESASQAVNKKGNSYKKPSQVIQLSDVVKTDYQRVSTGIGEFDRVLGGGIVPGSVVLIAGDPGIGKSTLLSQLAINVGSTLYVAGEESAQQIKIRIDRIQKNAKLSILQEVDVDAIIAALEAIHPPLVIVDSIQTLETTDLNSAAGSVGQVRECAHRLQRIAKALKVPIFIVGHVTKEGSIAGPRTLEHLVDTVLQLEGDTTSSFRILRGIKNRFGPTDEVGIFEMFETGMQQVLNPSEIFLEGKLSAPGSAVTAIVTGLRPMLLEIQALVTKTNSPVPRRVGTGFDTNRLQILSAVLAKRAKLPLWDMDVFVNVTGGIRITEPAADLAVCMAIISSFRDQALPEKAVFIGEVGLLGELRPIRQLDKRISEAKSLGYTTIISSQTAKTLGDVINKSLGSGEFSPKSSAKPKIV